MQSLQTHLRQNKILLKGGDIAHNGHKSPTLHIIIERGVSLLIDIRNLLLQLWRRHRSITAYGMLEPLLASAALGDHNTPLESC